MESNRVSASNVSSSYKPLESGAPAEWEPRSYKAGDKVQKDGRVYTAKWYAEATHKPGAEGWQGEPWQDDGECE